MLRKRLSLKYAAQAHRLGRRTVNLVNDDAKETSNRFPINCLYTRQRNRAAA